MNAVAWLAASTLMGVGAMRLVVRRPARSRWRRMMREDDAGPRPLTTLRAVTLTGRRGVPGEWSATPFRRRGAIGLVAVGAGTGAGAAAGLLAGAVTATYAALAVVLLARATARRAEARSYRAAVDSVAALRAGQAVGSALASASALRGPVVGVAAAAVVGRVAAAVGLAESSGAPLADVLERLDTHLRAADRARATASAQAAGARASALLLATMPVAGVGLGFAVGVDSVSVLLHTPLGSACLAGAVVLQLAGLAWAGRLSRVEVDQ